MVVAVRRASSCRSAGDGSFDIDRCPSRQTPLENMEVAVAAEGAGWDGVFVSDSITDGSTDPWSTLGAIAARTVDLDEVRAGPSAPR